MRHSILRGRHGLDGGHVLVESGPSAHGEIRFPSLEGDYSQSPSAQATWHLSILAWVFGGLLAACLAGILMLLPLHAWRLRHNEASAIGSMKSILRAETQYRSTYPARGYACSLAALAGIPRLGPPTAASAQLLSRDLSTGIKNGYFFDIRDCKTEKINGADLVTSFRIIAVPVIVGKSGFRGFCTDESGALPKIDPAGGTNCTQDLTK